MSYNITITDLTENVTVNESTTNVTVNNPAQSAITLEYNATIVQGAQGFTGSGGQGFTGSKGDIGFSGSQGDQGTSGYAGSKGDLGYTGSIGIGYAGSKGDQGTVGYAGSKGDQGTAGFTGSKGDVGFTGSKGDIGSQGDKAGLRYKFSTTTTLADPGVGYVRFNTGTNKIFVSRYNVDGVDIGDAGFTEPFGQWAAGSTLFIEGNSNTATAFFRANITLVLGKIDSGETAISWYEITYNAATDYFVGSFANDEDIVIQNSNRGYTGSQGIQGIIGFTGSKGDTGFIGSKGDTGFVGSAGPSNIINATDDTASTTLYPVMVNAAGTAQTAKTTSSKLEFNAATGIFKVTGEIVADKLTIQYTTVTTTSIVTDDVFTVLNTTTSNSTTTGALVVRGGVGIGKDVFIGGQTNVGGHILPTTTGLYDLGSPSARFKTLYVTSSTIDIGGATLSVSPEGYIDIDKISLSNTTDSTSISSGSFITAGGAGIAKNLYVGGDIVRNGITVGYGYTGSQGDLGYTGSQGIQGDTGYIGSQGGLGDLGYTGSQGYDGSQGDIGYTGSRGSLNSDQDLFTTSSVQFNTLYLTGDQESFSNGTESIRFGNEAYLGRQDSLNGLNDGLVLRGHTDYQQGWLRFGNSFPLGRLGRYATGLNDGGEPSTTDAENPLVYTSQFQAKILAVGTSTVVFTLPSTDGSNGQALVTNGSGVVTWSNNTGYVGSKGDIGYTGSKGDLGYAGSQGFTGLQGEQGFTGSKGDLGYTGSQGEQGLRGYSSGRFYYFNYSQTNIAGFRNLGEDPTTATQHTSTVTATPTANTLIESYISDAFDFTLIPGGPQQFRLHMSKGAENNDVDGFVRLKLAANDGTVISTIGDSSFTAIGWDVNNTTPVELLTDIVFTTTAVEIGQRIIVEVWARNNDGQNRTVKFYTEGTSYYSYVTTTVEAAIGITGYTGSKGDLGYTGSQGEQGYTGSEGLTGYVGSQGDLGYTGSQGDQANTGDITFSGVKIQGAGTASGDGYGYSTIELVPDTDLYTISTSSGAFGNSGGQYLIIDPTSPNHVHVRAGGPIDQAQAQLILGGEKANITVRDQDNSYLEKHYVTINTESTASTHYSWIFGDDGGLTFPTLDVDLRNGGVQSGQVLQFADTSKQVIITGPTPAAGDTAQRLIIQGQRASGSGEGGDVYLWGGDSELSGGDIKIYAGDGGFASTGSGGYVNITAGGGWDNGGNINITAGNSAVTSGNVTINAGGGSGTLGYVNVTAGGNTWGFNPNGDLTFPDSTVQTTAYPGGVTGYTGSLGDQGYTGSQGDTGFVGSQGDLGYVGSQGDQGYTGSQGDTGFVGSKGDIGYTGSKGDQGYTGSQGDIGYTGSKGDQGYTGSQGIQGELGYVGSKGDTGLGFNIAKSYASVAALTADTSPTGIVAGEFAIIETGDNDNPENSRLYLWNGATYSYTTDLSGGVGITGAQGDIGYVGSRGDQGYTGSQGDIGFTGSQGDQGYTGSQGDIGFTGSQGIQGELGYTGSQGDVGFVGSQGDVGFTGSQGDLGYTGSQGDLGYTGSAGVNGLETWTPVYDPAKVARSITGNFTKAGESTGYMNSAQKFTSVYISGRFGSTANTAAYTTLGFSNDVSTESTTRIKYGWMANGTFNQAQFSIDGSPVGPNRTISTDSLLSITYDGANIVWLIDNEIIGGYSDATLGAVYLDTLFYGSTAAIRDITFSYLAVDGAAGAAGSGYTTFGAWVSGGTYLAGTVVTYLGSTYVAMDAIVEETTPPSEGGYWMLFAAGGEIGYTGSQGDLGYTGSQGDLGYTGSQGDQGIQGELGYVGSQGDQGYTGSAGDLGYTGSQGDSGYVGSQGIQGDLGYTGSAGTNGTNGDVGFTGSQGIQGDLGYTGSTGAGFTGSAGTNGTNGFTGSQGVGFTGSIGYTGSAGSASDSAIIIWALGLG